jgi:ATP-binding cassette subfamily B protein/subfamily B ATP-binding cassette protein MsbA
MSMPLPEGRAKDKRAVLRRLMAYLAPFRPQLWAILLLVTISSAAQAAGPALIGRAIDTHIVARDITGLNRSMLLLLAVYSSALIFGAAQIRLMGRVGQQFLSRLRMQVFDTVQSLPLSFFDRVRAGDLMSRLVNDIQVINQIVSQGLIQVVGNLFALLGILVAMFLLSPLLALATFAILPLMLWTTQSFARRSRRAFQQTRRTIGEVSSTLQEDIAGVRVSQAFGRSEASIREFAQQNAANRDANIQANAVTAAFSPAIDFLSIVATVIVAAFGGWLALQGRLPVGTVVAFFIYIQNFFRPIQIIASIYTQLQAALAGAERIFELVDEHEREYDTPGAVELPRVQGRVSFEDVYFVYGERGLGNRQQGIGAREQAISARAGGNGVEPGDGQERWTLRAINLDVAPGMKVALVGPTGAGKTTLVNLLPRFYEVAAGRVLIDGMDVRDVTLASLRRQIGIVLQESFLFAGSVADNIRYGRLDASQDEVEAAARTVHAHEFILGLPEGYATLLGERGGGLSQGQRQLVTFARAVLADPRILILDEATANVDRRTEALIQDALERLMRGRTSFVIAHRLATVQDADLVVVIDGGRIVERGTHAELLARGARYAELYRRQFRER